MGAGGGVGFSPGVALVPHSGDKSYFGTIETCLSVVHIGRGHMAADILNFDMARHRLPLTEITNL